MFLNTGKNKLISYLNTNAGYGVLGTSTTAVTLADTSLGSAVIASSDTFSDTVTDKQIIFDYTLSSTELGGSTFSEFGVYENDNTLLSRHVFASLTHDSTEEWQISTRLFFN